MSTPGRLTVAAALAVALASSALVPVFADLGWLFRVLGGIAAVAGAGALARAARLPRLLQPLAALLGLAVYVVAVFAPSTLSFGILPGAETLRLLGDTIGQGLLDVEELAPPVPTRPGLVLLAVLGTGAIAVLVDALAVPLRRVAVTGLPLLTLFAVPSAVLPGGVGLLPFVLGAAGWLGLLLADGSDRVSRWGTPLQSAARRSTVGDPSLGRVGRRIGAAALGVALVVPALVPGLDGRLLGEGSGSGFGGSRTTTTYNPITRLAGQLRLPEPRRLLTYDSASPEYLRLTTLDVFDEASGWSSSELSGDVQDDAVQEGIPTPIGQTSTSERQVSTSIQVSRGLDGPWLPVPFPPEDIDIEGPWIWDVQAETAFSTRTLVSDLDEAYVVRANPVEPTAALLGRSQSPPQELAETYAQPPVVSDYVRDLVERTTAEQPTDYDKVVALQALFRDPANGFRYDEDASAPGINAPDALENFLRGRVGFCEQYASSMAAMVRSLGIPARVAVGFVPGRAVEPGRFEVTTSDAHAWPEVWFDGAGWVRFEPTPREGAVSVPDYSTPAVETPASDPTDTPSAAPLLPPVAPGADPEALDRAGEDGAAAPGGEAEGQVPTAVLALPLVLLVLAAPALLAAARRRRRGRDADPRTAWAILRDDAVDVGHRWRDADSPRTATAHLLAARSLGEPAREALHRLAAAVERARYARPETDGLHLHPTAEPDLDHRPATGAPVHPAADSAGHDLRRDVRVVRSGLLATVGRTQRWRARLLPPSTVRWAATTLGTAVADALDRVDLGLTAARRRLRHPRSAAGQPS